MVDSSPFYKPTPNESPKEDPRRDLHGAVLLALLLPVMQYLCSRSTHEEGGGGAN